MNRPDRSITHSKHLVERTHNHYSCRRTGHSLFLLRRVVAKLYISL